MKKETIKAGDVVHTPRFLDVTIKEVFASEKELREAGYTEPTHFEDPKRPFRVNGKSIGVNRMEFAAAPKLVVL